MKATYVSGSGDEGTSAVVEVDGREYECMNCLGYGRARACKPGEIVNLQFAAGLIRENDRGHAAITENERQLKGLEQIAGWRYRAYGIVINDDVSVRLDCGICEIELSFSATEATPATGEFIAIEVERLECWQTSA